MKDLKISHAIVIAAVVLTLGGLAYADKDAGVVVAGVIAVLGALGVVAKQQAEVKEQNVAIKEQTNGTNAALIGIINRQHGDLVRLSDKVADRLAELPPPPKEPPAV